MVSETGYNARSRFFYLPLLLSRIFISIKRVKPCIFIRGFVI